MYDHCYDDNHSFMEFNAENGKYNKKRRKGIYDKLLCGDCEDIIKEYEDYAKKIIYLNAKPAIEVEKKAYCNNNYDYRLLKLFVLSLLWRASISSQDSFKQASLGKYEEELRDILLDGLNTSVDNYPSYLYQTHIDGDLSNGVFMEIYPTKSKFDGKTIYQFVADGIFFFVGVGKQTLKTFSDGSSMTPERLIVGYDSLMKLPSLLDAFSRLHQQGKLKGYD